MDRALQEVNGWMTGVARIGLVVCSCKPWSRDIVERSWANVKSMGKGKDRFSFSMTKAWIYLESAAPHQKSCLALYCAESTKRIPQKACSVPCTNARLRYQRTDFLDRDRPKDVTQSGCVCRSKRLLVRWYSVLVPSMYFVGWVQSGVSEK